MPGSGRSPGEGNGTSLQYSRLDNSMDRGAWWATVHGIAESHTTERLTDTHIQHSIWDRVSTECWLQCQPVFDFGQLAYS